MKKVFWERGQRTALAKMVKMSTSHLSDILHRRRAVSKERAMLLEHCSGRVLGYPVPFSEWLFNATTKHPAFFGKSLKR